MSNEMSYADQVELVHNGITTQAGNCPVTPLLEMLQGRWKFQIIYELCIQSPIRFGELKKSIGHVSQKVLTAQLRDMEANGLVHRKVYAEVPPRVEYSLTELGQSLKPITDAMGAWGEKYQAKNQN